MGIPKEKPLTTVLAPHLRTYRRPLLILIFLQLVAVTTTLLLPNLNGRIVDEGIAHADVDAIVTIGAIMLALALVNLCASVAATIIGSFLATSIGRDIRNSTYSRVQQFSDTDLHKFGVPSLITRSTNDINQLQLAVFIAMTVLATAPVLVVGGTLMALSENVRLAPVVIVIAAALTTVVVVIVRKLIPSYSRLQSAIDGVGRVLREQLTGIKVIRSFGREELEESRFDTANTELTTTSHRIGSLQAIMLPSIILIANVGAAAVIGVGAVLVGNNSMEVGGIIAFVGYLTQILIGLSIAAAMVALVPRAQVSARRVQEILGTVPSVQDPDVCRVPAIRTGEVELSGVGFRYPGAEHAVLSDIDLQCRPGTLTAVLGGTGDGKSTLLSLIPRFCDATSGRVLIDGIDVRERERSELYQDISYVAQVPALLSGTLAANLRLGRPDASDDDLRAALDVACATDFVFNHEQGLHQEVQHGGGNLSGGQRQRLALAQAIVHRPRLLLLDDPFSALDPETESRVKQKLRRALPDTVILLTAQRVSSTAGADTIVVLSGGRICARGTHDELIGSSSTYREILDSQAALR
ncbi:ABC transporter ATP-binding protein [Gordonia rubripertincta]|uniref:ABC transporter ATP-binding protein n=1 Tax=Gordonia rubripertincta TaxID=36822 RepID=A0ABT4MXZ5_GORRU|nr:ABC transporter ATP-binding protein [Gordonia rubripertincta]MCZ4551871.1 ABC transporter ATP-binding protein [Gordonia rubripertincta]